MQVARRSIAFVALLSLIHPAYSFDVDGFKTGMTFAAARALVESHSYSHVEVKDGHIGAWDTPPSSSGRTISLIFCKGRLVLIQKHLQPRFDYFVRLVDDKRKELGRPRDSWAQPADVTATVESNSVKFVWRDGSDFVVVSYTQFSSNNQLDIVHETPNDCWRHPY